MWHEIVRTARLCRCRGKSREPGHLGEIYDSVIPEERASLMFSEILKSRVCFNISLGSPISLCDTFTIVYPTKEPGEHFANRTHVAKNLSSRVHEAITMFFDANGNNSSFHLQKSAVTRTGTVPDWFDDISYPILICHLKDIQSADVNGIKLSSKRDKNRRQNKRRESSARVISSPYKWRGTFQLNHCK
jgi:hypothetical protein